MRDIFYIRCRDKIIKVRGTPKEAIELLKKLGEGEVQIV